MVTEVHKLLSLSTGYTYIINNEVTKWTFCCTNWRAYERESVI